MRCVSDSGGVSIGDIAQNSIRKHCTHVVQPSQVPSSCPGSDPKQIDAFTSCAYLKSSCFSMSFHSVDMLFRHSDLHDASPRKILRQRILWIAGHLPIGLQTGHLADQSCPDRRYPSLLPCCFFCCTVSHSYHLQGSLSISLMVLEDLHHL